MRVRAGQHEQPEADRQPERRPSIRACDAAGARSWLGPPQIDEIEREDLALERRQPAFPGRHVALPPAHTSCMIASAIAAVDPELVGQVRAPELACCPCRPRRGRRRSWRRRPPCRPSTSPRLCRFAAGWIGERSTRPRHSRSRSRWQHLVAPEGRHLRDAAVRMRRVDADPDGLGNRLRVAAPEPDVVVRSGKPWPPLRVRPWQAAQLSPNSVRPVWRTTSISAGSAWISLIALGLDLLRPAPRDRAPPASATPATVVALVGAEQALGVGRAERPGRHQHPVADAKRQRDDRKK